MKRTTTHDLRFAPMRLAMLAALLAISFTPVLSATSHFTSTKPLFLSTPAKLFTMHEDAAIAGLAAYRRAVISATTAESVTRASIMWGASGLQNSSAMAGPTLAQAHDALSPAIGNTASYEASHLSRGQG